MTFVAAPTEQNLQQLGRGPNEEREEKLFQKMQSLSALLGKVDTLMAEGSDTASRPPTQQRLHTSSTRPLTQQRLDTASSRPETSRSHTVQPHAPESMGEAELRGQPEPSRVQYTGAQSQTAGIQRLRKIDARATKSTIGSLLSWAED